MEPRYVVILAAGMGTRMKSDVHKVLHKICGRTMVEHVLTQVSQVQPKKIITVVGHDAQAVKDTLGDRTEYVDQPEQLGTGHAVLQTAPVLADKHGVTLVVSGDTPLLTAATFNKLLQYHTEKGAKATILTATAPDPTGYGRIIRNDLGIVERIVEQKDTNHEEAAIQEINTGVYCFDNQALFEALRQVKNNNAQGEYYLTDVISIIRQAGGIIAAYRMKDFEESMGVNDRVALANATKVMQHRINTEFMMAGVSMIDPDTTYIDVGAKIGQDTIIEPGVQIQGNTTIGSHCVVGAHSLLIDATIEDNVKITSSTIEHAIMRKGSDIGPHSHLRPQADIGEDVHIGNFCEVKNATLGARTKMGHLSYVGDATLGTDINIGCGVVFVNYDGVKKWHSKVGDKAFIGSNSNVVAPVDIADHSFIAAGSTITKDLPYHAMGIARARQVNKDNYWDKLPLSQSDEWK
ncbi:bifunctional UDP-N-acetylglucosamine diphosphorylase/glucosamine-1-phosphate N-acetyltransferase GlmU [Schleiferilactobacillus perolens]|jgi:bifunctional UDP-N-acetylglucosamine pyrophosphorylase/glucosamine-1-phosphate N-acetyltransferase|uniref:bifunctional UDP-N-acetylglucosamine diphosphorylase/glucosamine-1-phosphate N-acetyltransferase GlmU n=1 Tax=Schleiferilactobacillus perolens TaxID=100468 RepID=UPI002356BEDF|nr:bifunctional UDP-N-acetylglucosamine diphosphorylase/glucosamine-1-phosphate N-acetyltransferase GlmU [Schleiferilactobacillus perolens]MCI1892866.1 bifunctional UDP-N-acetylglucosamine diphosphorylase/glucosamine-1-phosphate N-acetyltransferase GlmU [Schleiferilactobacillus harbinensis]MCI1912780.1 bifunctional UDP-N-acetylglucosamine diphosphorylase/glucosamine-1-phosphate N-acetyltransferase GlmU [Schleiferilactobacillus harbinensis]MCI2172408.1 bifunctional UDP-N-acetylglucosamine diphosp